jgi:hypothetical protein
MRAPVDLSARTTRRSARTTSCSTCSSTASTPRRSTARATTAARSTALVGVVATPGCNSFTVLQLRSLWGVRLRESTCTHTSTAGCNTCCCPVATEDKWEGELGEQEVAPPPLVATLVSDRYAPPMASKDGHEGCLMSEPDSGPDISRSDLLNSLGMAGTSEPVMFSVVSALAITYGHPLSHTQASTTTTMPRRLL